MVVRHTPLTTAIHETHLGYAEAASRVCEESPADLVPIFHCIARHYGEPTWIDDPDPDIDRIHNGGEPPRGNERLDSGVLVWNRTPRTIPLVWQLVNAHGIAATRDIVNREDLDLLIARDRQLRALLRARSFLTTDALADSIDQVIHYQRRHRESLVASGYPTEACHAWPAPLGVNLYPLAWEGESLDPGLDAARLVRGRSAMFDLKLRLFTWLSGALRCGTAIGLWDDCLRLLTDAILAEDAEFYLDVDRRRGPEVRHVGRLEWRSWSPLMTGGLTEISEIIGHCEQELNIGTMDRAKRELASLVDPEDLRPHLAAVNTPERVRIDAILDAFDASRSQFAELLADAEAGRFDVIVVHKLDRVARNRRVAFDAFHRLGSSGIGFVSIAENMDYSTPAGQLMLTMLVGMAQFYSDNLSWETKNGKEERKARGLYNGLLPFGTTKGPQRVPTLDTTPWACQVATQREIVPADGLQLAFDLAAGGKSDREIARALNDAGHCTSGNRGHNPFTKDSVRVILTNRFYVGELPDGQGGWVPGKHGALIDPTVFERAQAARERNATRPRRVKTEKWSPWALSGLATCACGATMTAYGHASGRQRVQCSRRTQTRDCDAPTFFASVVEEQLADFLQGFAVPENERGRLVAAWRERQRQQRDRSAERVAIHRKLTRIRDLYEEGDLDRATYQAKKAILQADLAALPEGGAQSLDVGDRLAEYLADVALAWRVATPEERNKLARQMFNAVIIENRTTVEITPRPDLLPFFATLANESSSVMTYRRKRRDSNPRSQP